MDGQGPLVMDQDASGLYHSKIYPGRLLHERYQTRVVELADVEQRAPSQCRLQRFYSLRCQSLHCSHPCDWPTNLPRYDLIGQICLDLWTWLVHHWHWHN